MNLRFVFLGLILLCVGAATLAQSKPGINMRAGLWRIDVEMTLPGKGPEGGGPVFREMCLNAENMQQIVMPQSEVCQATVTKQQRDSMDWKMTCRQGPYDTFSAAHFEFSGDKMAGAILTKAISFGMEFRTVVRGKYLGNCPAGMAPQPQRQPVPLAPANPGTPEKPAAQLKPYKP